MKSTLGLKSLSTDQQTATDEDVGEEPQSATRTTWLDVACGAAVFGLAWIALDWAWWSSLIVAVLARSVARMALDLREDRKRSTKPRPVSTGTSLDATPTAESVAQIPDDKHLVEDAAERDNGPLIRRLGVASSAAVCIFGWIALNWAWWVGLLVGAIAFGVWRTLTGGEDKESENPSADPLHTLINKVGVVVGSAVCVFGWIALDWTWWVGLLLGVITWGIIAPGLISWLDRQRAEEEADKRMMDSVAELPKFSIHDKFVSRTSDHKRLGLFLDVRSHRVAIYEGDNERGHASVYGCRDLRGAELVVDEDTVVTTETKTRRGNQIVGAAVGGLVAGRAGAVVGGLSAGQKSVARQETTVSRVVLRIFFRDLMTPEREIVFYRGQAAPRDSAEVRLAIGRARKWTNKIRILADV